MQGPDTRKSLLLHLRDHSHQQAWAEFVAIYEPLIYRLARSKGLQHADAEDLTQDAFAAIGNAIDRFDPEGEGSFRGWLHRITRNLIINFLTRRREPVGSGDTDMHNLLHQHPSDDEEATTLFELQHRREVFRWAARNVRPMFREDSWRAFWLSGVEGEPIEEVAQLLGKTPGAVRVARCRVLARLQHEVKSFDSES